MKGPGCMQRSQTRGDVQWLMGCDETQDEGSEVIVSVRQRAGKTQQPAAEDYVAAAAILPGNLAGLVKNESVRPHWLHGSSEFWYQRDGESGPEYVTVDTRTGKKRSGGGGCGSTVDVPGFP